MRNTTIAFVSGLLVSLCLGTQSAHAIHNDFVILAIGPGGNPAFQVLGFDGTVKGGAFVLSSTFPDIELDQSVRVGSGSGHERILVSGSSPVLGHLFQVFERDGTLVGQAFPLNSDFTDVSVARLDINGDGIDEIAVLGVETTGLARGPAFQVFNQSGVLLGGGFILNASFTDMFACEGADNRCTN